MEEDENDDPAERFSQWKITKLGRLAVQAAGEKLVRRAFMAGATWTPAKPELDTQQLETRKQFEDRYTDCPLGVFGRDVVALLCTCEAGGGPTHWAAIANTPEAIQDHQDLEAILVQGRICSPT